MMLCMVAGFGEGDRAMREDREDRDAYRRGPLEGQPTPVCTCKTLTLVYKLANAIYTQGAEKKH